jgi:ribose transport system substrate-binding protein
VVQRFVGRTHVASVILAVVVLTMVSACASKAPSIGNSAVSSRGSSTASSTGSSGAGDPAAVSAAQKALAAFVNPSDLVWPKPTTAFTTGHHKLAILIPGPAGASVTQGNAAKAAAEAMGWQATIFDGNFDPSKQAGYIQQAVQSGYDAIFISVVDPNSMRSAIQYAESRGVPIACASCVDGSHVPNDGIMYVTNSMTDAGTAIADYMIAHSNGSPSIQAFTDLAFPPVIARINAIGAQVKAICPKCTYNLNDFPTSDVGKPGPPTWTAFLASHPTGVDWVATGYESMAVPFAQTLTQQGRTDIKITSFDNTLPDSNQLIVSGNSAYQATAAFPYTYEAWAGVDLLARAVNHQPTWDATKLPFLIVDKDNVGYFTGKPDLIPATFDYKSMFEALWR